MTDSKTKIGQAIRLFDSDDLLHALPLLEELNTELPNNGTVLQYLGDTQRLLNMTTEAYKNLETAYNIVSAKNKGYVAGRLGLLSSDNRSTFEAENWYRTAVNDSDTFVDWIWVLRGQNLIKMGQVDAGIAVLLEALMEPECQDKDEVYLTLALGEQARKNYEKSKEYAMASLDIDPSCNTAKELVERLDDYFARH